MKNLNSLGLRYIDSELSVLDQTLLPGEERWLVMRNVEDMIEAIQRLAVRGAPLIGVAAAMSLADAWKKGTAKGEGWKRAALALREARPTAVNLMAAMDRMLAAGEAKSLETAEEIFLEDVRLCDAMAERGAALVKDGENILTHCNTGGLATVGVGTALGVIRKAHEQGKKIHVYVDETRPLLQGARLTAWELGKLGIPYTLICDNMAGALMAQKKIQRIFVGADRVTARGDAANKIGTYSVAVLAHYHKIPFYIVAPETTLDRTMESGTQIPIEERKASEVRGERSPKDAPVWNPAFDVTPRELITNIITDKTLL